MRYTRLRVWAIFLIVIIGVIVVLTYSSGGPGIYKSESPITDSLLTASYPDLYNAISQREAAQLKPFLSHEHSEVREQAWRALANTPVDSISNFLRLAKKQNSEAAWFGLSKHNFKYEQLRELEQHWIKNPRLRSGIARVLGQQGDQESLDFLVGQLDKNVPESQYQHALAIGRLVRQFKTDQDEQIRIIQNAFNTENYEATRAYLYGWYRGDESQLAATAQDTLFGRWELMGTGISRIVDQYVNKILPKRTTYNMTIYYNGEQLLDEKTRLSYELANSLDKIALTDKNSLAAKILLTNANTHVKVRTLQSLSGKITKTEDIYGYIRDSIISDSTMADKVWLQALLTGLTVDSDIADDYQDRLNQIPQNNPYLWPQVLAVYQKIDNTDRYLKRIGRIVEGGDSLSTMFALQSFDGFWQELPPEEKTDKRIEQVRATVFQALELGDRGVAFMAQPLLENQDLFATDDFGRINQSLAAFSLPDDIEVYQVFGSLYKSRFEEQAKPVIDSLAAQKNVPLNRSLAETGWDVSVPEESRTEFRIPDWQRLWELGRSPVFTLQTEKGAIEMQLNTLSAPATVAMIDSLNQAKLYRNVPFHRVVPNFVIQGGDIERQDGFGGPDFVIPTEGSEAGFVRGAVGIASAGTDTEGSQYFIMHQWKPHLNGNYTRFGKVIEGMDVVDRVTEGDKVLYATWY